MKAQQHPSLSSMSLACALISLVMVSNGFISRYIQDCLPSSKKSIFSSCHRVTTTCCATMTMPDGLQSRNNSEHMAITSTTMYSESDPDSLRLLSQLYTYRKPRQERRPASSRPRKQRYYWQSHDNLRSELFQFWDELSVTIPPNQPPPIPSEYLLNYFHRNDLRWGISQMGGRDFVAHILGGAKVIPGKWEKATELDEVKQLLPRMDNGHVLPRKTSIQQSHNRDQDEGRASTNQKIVASHSSATLSSLVLPCSDKHTNSTTSRTKEFWSKEKTIKNM